MRKRRNLIYEIFVDRFAGPEGRELHLPQQVDRPWNHHCGGTLDGIAARLDHVISLGADAVYLTPIFCAESNHKYDTTDFEKVDPLFGGEAAFASLARSCQARGMGLILDGVFNHVGHQHEWFRNARTNSEALHAEFFKWNDYPERYSCWRGHKNLPELNLECAELAQQLYSGDNSILRQWLRRGATGWRLDCANDIGIEVCSHAFTAAAEEQAPDGIVAEVMGYAEKWAQPGVVDGVMNYYFRETVLSVTDGAIVPLQAAYNLEHMVRHYGGEQLLGSWNVLATHDTPRLASMIPDIERRSFALALAFAYPGIPFIYYGDEIGMCGTGDPECRGPMVWDRGQWQIETLETVTELAAIRNAQPALQNGNTLFLPQPGSPEIIAFARVTDLPQETVVVVANASDRRISARVFAPYSYLFDALPLRDLLQRTETVWMRSGRFDITLEPWAVAFLSPDPECIPGYSFYE